MNHFYTAQPAMVDVIIQHLSALGYDVVGLAQKSKGGKDGKVVKAVCDGERRGDPTDI